MRLQDISPDQVVYWNWEFVKVNSTLVHTWIVMVIMVVGSWLITRKLSSDDQPSRWQNLLEMIVNFVRNQIRDVSRQDPDVYLPFIGTLFLFIAFSNALTLLPDVTYTPPMASLSTTAALAICVFFAVPIFGLVKAGPAAYFKHYITPSPLMLPFNIIGEISRTLALAVRLFGNVMSGGKIVAILLAIAPLFFPVVMKALGLLTGLIHAYIFALLAVVYIASGMEAQTQEEEEQTAESRRKETKAKT